jgi:nucleotide-binding universal stress UspA family protein
MKSILVPIDFSQCSKNALKAAIQIADKIGASIELVHIYDRPVIGFVDLNIDHTKLKTLQKEIDKTMKSLIAEYNDNNIKLTASILNDISLVDVFDLPRFENLEMVVMGSQGTSGLKELFIGSNTEKIVRRANCPVLCVKETTDLFNLKNVVLASNFYKEIELVFPQIDSFLNIFNPHYNLLKVCTPNNFETTRFSRRIMQAFADKFKIKDYDIHVYNDNHVESGILNFAKEIEADAIIIATHGRRGIEHFINGSLAEDVVNHAVTPVLSFKLIKPDKNDNVLFPE